MELPSDDDPEALYRALIAGDPESPLPRFSLARLCLDSDRAAEAAELLRFCVGKTPDWAAALLMLGDALARTGDAQGAADVYARCKTAALAQNHGSLAEEADAKSAQLK